MYIYLDIICRQSVRRFGTNITVSCMSTGNVSVTSMFFRDLHNLLPPVFEYVLYSHADNNPSFNLTSLYMHIIYTSSTTTHMHAHSNGTAPKSFVASSEIYSSEGRPSGQYPFRDTPISFTFILELVCRVIPSFVVLVLLECMCVFISQNETEDSPRCAFWDFSNG